jgi:hypothetical protein
MTTLDAIRHNLEALAAQAQTAGDALDGARVDLAEGTLAELLLELESLDGRMALVLDRLAGAAGEWPADNYLGTSGCASTVKSSSSNASLPAVRFATSLLF